MPPLVRLRQALHAAPCHLYMEICGVIEVKQDTRPSSRDCAQQMLFCMLWLQHRHPEATVRAASLLPLPVFVSSQLRMCSSLQLWSSTWRCMQHIFDIALLSSAIISRMQDLPNRPAEE
jgi:hypothetical protein